MANTRQRNLFEKFKINNDLFNEENFLIAKHNSCAISYIRNWPTWLDKVLVLSGGISIGKTHIAKIWSTQSGAQFFNDNHILSDEYISYFKGNFIIEDIDRILEKYKHSKNIKFKLESHLFNIINNAIAGENYALITLSSMPSDIIPDLTSRLKRFNTIHIENPSKEFLDMLFIKYSTDYNMEIESEILDNAKAKIGYSAEKIGRFFYLFDKYLNESGKKISKKKALQIISSINKEKQTK